MCTQANKKIVVSWTHIGLGYWLQSTNLFSKSSLTLAIAFFTAFVFHPLGRHGWIYYFLLFIFRSIMHSYFSLTSYLWSNIFLCCVRILITCLASLLYFILFLSCSRYFYVRFSFICFIIFSLLFLCLIYIFFFCSFCKFIFTEIETQNVWIKFILKNIS